MQNLLLELKTNPRLRIGLSLIVAIVWFYAVLDLRDRTDAASQQLAVQARQVARLAQQGAQTAWVETARVSGERRARAEKVLWTTETVGSASAALQDWLQEKARQSGIAQMQVTLADAADRGPFGATVLNEKPESLPAGISKVKGRMTFEFDGPAFDRFMTAVGAGDHPIFIDSLLVRNVTPGRAELQFFALARVNAAAGARP